MSTVDLGLDTLHALIVDDDSDTRFLNQYALKDIGVGHIGQVSSIPEMFHYLNQCSPPVSLILMDVMMPGMNGIEGLRALNHHPEFSEIPVIMLTTLSATEKLEEAFDAGATDYVTKPFKYPELKARVLAALKKQNALNQLKVREQLLLEQHEALKLKQRNLERNVYADGLTHIPNRRAFNDGLERLWQRSLSKQEPLGILMSDVDYFKRYNDIYGHQKGDECLQQVAKNLPALTADALPARYGGEEFAVVISGEKARQVYEIAEQVRLRVMALKIPHLGSEIAPYVTLSLGCVFHDDVSHLQPEDMLKQADEALYTAKHEGRNRVHLFTSK